MAAIKSDNLDELERLLDDAKEKGLRRVHGTKGQKYLRRRKKEKSIQAAIDSKGPVDALREALEGAADAGCPLLAAPSAWVGRTLPVLVRGQVRRLDRSHSDRVPRWRRGKERLGRPRDPRPRLRGGSSGAPHVTLSAYHNAISATSVPMMTV